MARKSAYILALSCLTLCSCVSVKEQVKTPRLSWSVETFDDASDHKQADLKLSPGDFGRVMHAQFDAQGDLHVVYVIKDRMVYAKRGHAPGARQALVKEPLPLTVGEFARDIRVVTGSGLTAVAPGVHGLSYMQRVNDGWAVRLIADKIGQATLWTVTLGAQGNPVIAYANETGGIAFIEPEGAAWQEFRVPMAEEGWRLRCLTAAFDSQKRLHVGFVTSQNDRVKLWHAVRDRAWSVEDPVYKGKRGEVEACSAVFDGDLALSAAVVVAEGANDRLIFISRKGKKWQDEVLADPFIDEQHLALFSYVFDTAGRAHLVFYDAQAKTPVYLFKKPNGAWGKMSIGSAVDTQVRPTIAIDPSGKAWILFQDAARNSLRLARQR
ncbi:MAG: hypothetical protein AABZ44_02620 [Elusimicrobiota bacterium]